jgi:Tfp pilus assembly protein PilO
MNTDFLQKYYARFKNPTIQLVTVILVGLLLNVFLFTTKIQPNFVEKTLLNQSIASLEKQRNVIAESPLPAKVDANEVQLLIVQVPTDFEISRLLLEFESIERDSGAIITDLSVGDQEIEVKDELADYIENALKKAPAVAAAVPTTPTDPANSIEQPVPAPSEPKLATPIKAELLSLKVTGTYLQVTDFMGRLYKMKRIINIRKWSLAPLDEEQYEIVFGLTVYTAPKYAGTFHDLPTINTEIPKNIGKPVMSNEEFKKILESQP